MAGFSVDETGIKTEVFICAYYVTNFIRKNSLYTVCLWKYLPQGVSKSILSDSVLFPGSEMSGEPEIQAKFRMSSEIEPFCGGKEAGEKYFY